MRKLLTWVVVTLGIAALVRKLRRRGEQSEPVPGVSPPPTPPSAEPADQAGSASADPAGELRQKLAESRAGEGSSPAAPSGSVEEPGSVEGRRAEVHEQGRAALEDMQPPEES